MIPDFEEDIDQSTGGESPESQPRPELEVEQLQPEPEVTAEPELEAGAAAEEEAEQQPEEEESADLVEQSEPDQETESLIRLLPVEAPEPEDEAEIEPELEIDPDHEVRPEPIQETRPHAEPVRQTAVAQPAESRGGCRVMVGYLLSALAGAFLGGLLALWFLFLVNGTLRFADDANTAARQQQLNDGLRTLQRDQLTAQAQMQTLQDTAAAQETALAGYGSDQAEFEATAAAQQEEMASLAAEATRLAGAVTDLNATAEVLEGQISVAAEAAEEFRAFLTGLRDLLTTVQGTSEPDLSTSETATPTRGLPASPTGSPAEASATPRPTRTPRPTATSLANPSPTPVP